MDMSLGALWVSMSTAAKGIVIVMIIMSVYSLTVAFERFLYYRKARNQSVAYAKMVTVFLKQDKLQDAIEAAEGWDLDRRIEQQNDRIDQNICSNCN